MRINGKCRQATTSVVQPQDISLQHFGDPAASSAGGGGSACALDRPRPGLAAGTAAPADGSLIVDRRGDQQRGRRRWARWLFIRDPDAATIVTLVQTAGVPFEAFDRVQAYLVVVAVLLRPGMERGGLTCRSR
ncbi:MAG TPA: hypothetical protein VM347_15255 [Nonomuraea sp.]|nr:hypothetical protein [Nonomuraea sp.]